MSEHDISEAPLVFERYARSFEGACEEVVKIVANPALETIIDATPVDTALAVSNWKVTHGESYGGVAPPITKSVKGSGAGTAKAAMKGEGFAKIQGFKLETPMFITNNVPYIGFLERGSRNVSPHNMVARGLQTAAQTAKGILVLKMTEEKL